MFEDNPYLKVTERPIRSRLLLSEGEDLTVNLPDKNCILGDKLTAFAPHTIGIPFGVDKELEIIKQMFDCWTLLQEMDDYSTVAEVYNKVSYIELGYRRIENLPSDCLRDTIDSCICIMGRGSVRAEDYMNFSSGINAIQGHIFVGRINGKSAGVYASEVMYLAANLLTGQTEYERISNPDDYRDTQLKLKGIKKISVIPSWKLQMMAYEVFHACLQDVDTILELAQGMLEKHINDRAERQGNPTRETEIREEIDELKKRIDRCTELRIDNEISNELYKKKKQEYEIRISDLKSELDEICGSEEIHIFRRSMV